MKIGYLNFEFARPGATLDAKIKIESQIWARVSDFGIRIYPHPQLEVYHESSYPRRRVWLSPF